MADGRRVMDGGSPILITGATGTLGRAFAAACDVRGLPYVLTRRSDLDIAQGDSVERVISAYAPWAVINTAGYVRVDDAETDGEACARENTLGAQTLAERLAATDIRLVTFSTDLVFDGNRSTPYEEEDAVGPLDVYGRTKADAER